MSTRVTYKQVDASIVIANGTHPFTSEQSMGGHRLVNLQDPVDPQDAVTKAFLAASMPPATQQGFWRYDANTTMADPGTGDLRDDTTLSASTTQIAISKNTSNGTDASTILRVLMDGDVVTIQDKVDAVDWARYVLTAPPIDNTTWFLLPVSYVEGGGTAPANNSALVLTFTYSGGGGSSIGTVNSVAATAPAAGFTITGSPITTSGTFVFTLADDLLALENLSGTNTLYYRSGTSAWSAVTIGANLTFSGGTLSASTGTSYTDEQAQDATWAMINAGTHSGISFVYNDAVNSISATVTPGAPSGLAGGDLSGTYPNPQTTGWTGSVP